MDSTLNHFSNKCSSRSQHPRPEEESINDSTLSSQTAPESALAHLHGIDIDLIDN